ncbi:MAG: isochorismatase family protein [Gammaproteobacteria bacterium]|nr:isochorismatase family protein [Gammaproteobacteria bacterium]
MTTFAVCLIDLQRDFCDYWQGALNVSGTDLNYINQVKNFTNYLRLKNYQIIFTADEHPEDSETFTQNIYSKLIASHKYIASPEITEDTKNSVVKWQDKNTQSFFYTWPKHCIKNTDGAKLVIEPAPTDKYFTKGEEIEAYSIVATAQSPIRHERIFNTRFLQAIEPFDTIIVYGLAIDFCVQDTIADLLSLTKNVILVYDLCKGIAHNALESSTLKLSKIAEAHKVKFESKSYCEI